MLWITVEVDIGDMFYRALRDAIALAVRLACGVQFTFNGQPVGVTPWDTVEERYACYCQKWGWDIEEGEDE